MTDAFGSRSSLSVSASAGSGKTWQLTTRIVRLLIGGAAPGEVLALTFTRKAAAEMRNRLNARLCRLAQAGGEELDGLLRDLGVEPNDEIRSRARALYGTQLFTPYPLRAMTLHAFCHDVLNRFALEAGLSPGFALVDNDAALQHAAWRRVQENIVRDPDGAEALAMRKLIALGAGPVVIQELVTGFLERRADWWAFTDGVEDPAAFAESELRRHLGNCDREAACAIVDGEAFNARFRVLVRQLEKIGGTRYLKPEAFERAAALQGVERMKALRRALFKKNGDEPYSISKSDLRKMSEIEGDHFVEKHREVVREFKRAQAMLLAGETLERSRAGWTLGIAALAQLQAELSRLHALTFSELEWRTYRLLRKDGAADWVRYKCDQKISHLLIDEFQDTSPTQWRMLLPLLEEMAAGGERERSLFIVGDTKQSIYGFRRANPRLFGVATDWMEENLRASRGRLDRSRRSAPAIIDFVNALFEPPELGNALDFQGHGTHRIDDWGRVELAPQASGGAWKKDPQPGIFRDPLIEGRPDREWMLAEEESRQVAGRIRALVRSRVQVADAAGGSHSIGYDDILVLARARTHLAILERALTEAGIPFVGAARGTLLETAEARDLTALLRWINAPHRDLDLAQVLRSPLFSVDDGDLVMIARQARESRCNWFDTLTKVAVRESRLKRAAVLLQRWRLLAARLPAHDLLDCLVSDSDAAHRYESALPPVAAARARGNLGAFMQLALEADSGRFPGLARFLEYLDELRVIVDAAPDEAPPAESQGLVRVMTVHAAKGLEAPAVFLFNAASVPPNIPPRWLVEWPEHDERPAAFLAAGPRGFRDTLTDHWLEAMGDRKNIEELNVLYVAVTRARQFLHISGFESKRKSRQPTWWDLCAQAMERLGKTTAAPLPGALSDCLHYGSGEPATGKRRPPGKRPSAPDALRRPLAERSETTIAAEPDAPTVQRGIAIHLLLQLLSEGADEGRLRGAVETRINARVDDRDFDEWLGQARSLREDPDLARFFDPSRYERAWNEVPVQLDDEGQTGVIDRLVDDGRTLWVVDYKTHAGTGQDELVEEYRGQLTGYVAAVTGLLPNREVRAGLLLTASRRWLAIDAA